MTYSSEERWEPALEVGSHPHSGVVESTFLHPIDLEALDAELALRASRAPIGFASTTRQSAPA